MRKRFFIEADAAGVTVARVVGVVLVTAAILKGSDTLLGRVVATADPPWGGPWLQVGLIEVEFLLGAALLLWPRWRLPRAAAILLFGAFIVALGLMLREGRTSCGCGGGWLRVSPLVALVFDTAAFLALVLLHPLGRHGRAGVAAATRTPERAAR